MNRIQVKKKYLNAATEKVITEYQEETNLYSLIRGSSFTMEEIVLTALAQSFMEVFEWSSFDVMLEGHGRQQEAFEDCDLSRTVGWFTCHFPLYLSLPNPGSASKSLRFVQDSLSAVPNKGLSYGVYRYLQARRELVDQQEPNILLNFLGQVDKTMPETSYYKIMEDLAGSFADDNARTHALGILSFVKKGKLTIEWDFVPEEVSPHQIQSLSESFSNHFGELLFYCGEQSDQIGEVSSDLIDLDQEDLDTLSELLGGSE